MMYNFLFLANQGMDIIRIDAVPYIWKELGTSCRNLKEVHTIVRMMLHDCRNCLSERDTSWRSGYGAGKGGAVLWYS